VSALVAASGPSAYWYLTRSTGAVALLLLTASVVLGVADVSRWQSPRWPRFVVDSLHRNVSLLALLFVGVHVLTSVLDSFAPISVLDAVVPFVGSYRPLWLGLGAVAFDLLLAVAITSMLRQRLGYRSWRATHWMAYACWPVALLHTLGTGSDVKSGWLLTLSAACLLAVLAAVAVRALRGWPERARLRTGALATAGALALGVLIWLPGGPLGKGWARRAGTPLTLLAASAAASTGGHPASTAAAGSSADAFQHRFSASLAGTMRQEPGPGSGLQTVTIATTFGGSPSGQLHVVIEGQALSGGGVALSASKVTLGSSASPALYRGQIGQLSGNHIAATVRSASGRALSLNVTIQTSASEGSVTGTLTATPVEA
jgi:hypothetical protein